MIVVHFKATANAEGYGLVTWESRAETEAEAIKQGKAWGQANKWTDVQWFLVDRHHVQSIDRIEYQQYEATAGHDGRGAWVTKRRNGELVLSPAERAMIEALRAGTLAVVAK